jgi:hypothetical protein
MKVILQNQISITETSIIFHFRPIIPWKSNKSEYLFNEIGFYSLYNNSFILLTEDKYMMMRMPLNYTIKKNIEQMDEMEMLLNKKGLERIIIEEYIELGKKGSS